MNKTRRLCVGMLAVAASSVAIASASAQAATLELRTTALGPVITNSAGFTVFQFTLDPKKMDKCVTIMGCSAVWPALEVTGTPTVGAGLSAKLVGEIMLPGGAMQVTYAGHPLYLYVGNSHPEETSYSGANEFGGTWYATNAKGKKAKPPKMKK